MTTTTEKIRPLSPAELAALVRVLRDLRKWSQETLACLSGLTPRTIQRVEAGESASADTRRALAIAFEMDDADVFNKPFAIPDAEALKAQQVEFEKNHVTLPATTITTGKELATLAEASSGDVKHEAMELDESAAYEFAALVDYVHEFRDCAELYGEVDKLGVHSELQNRIDNLAALDVSVCCAVRKVRLRMGSADAEGYPTSILYTAAFPKGKEPKELIVHIEVAWP